MTNQNGVKCYKSLSCIISVLIIVFIFGAILIDLAWTKPSIRQDISEINKELFIINSQIDRMDSLQTSTNQRFLEILENNHKVKLTQNPQPSDTITKHWNSIPSSTKVSPYKNKWTESFLPVHFFVSSSSEFDLVFDRCLLALRLKSSLTVFLYSFSCSSSSFLSAVYSSTEINFFI